MKWFLGILLGLSLAANTYFVVKEIRYKRMKEFEKMLNRSMGGVSDVPWEKGFKVFKDSLTRRYPALANKKYYYINMWNVICRPCIKEMPWLDSLAGTIDNKNIAYIFLSDNGESAVKACLEKRKFTIKNFVYLNDMESFFSAASKEQKHKSRIYPTVIIIDNNGKIRHSSTGAYESRAEANDFVELIRENTK